MVAPPPARPRFALSADGWHRPVLAALLIVGAALRLFRLGRESLWFDEIDQITLAALPIPQLLRALVWHASPPLDYLVTHAVVSLGRDETLVRLPAALASIAALYVVYRAGRQLWSTAVGLAACALLCFSMAAIAYAQEARMYSLFVLGAAGLLWGCARLADAPLAWRRWLAASASATALMYTHYFGALLLASLGVLWLVVCVWPRRNGALFRRGVVAFALVALGFAPWLPTLLEQAARRGGALSYATPRAYYWPSVTTFISGGVSRPLVVLWAALFALGLVASWRRRPIVAALLVAFVGAPLLLAFAVPAISRTVTERNMLFVVPGYLVGVAIGCAAIVEAIGQRLRGQRGGRGRVLEWVTVLGVAALALGAAAPMLSRYYTSHWWMKDAHWNWRDTARYLQGAMQPGDLVLTRALDERYTLAFYLDPLSIEGVTVSQFSSVPANRVSGAARYIPSMTLDAPPDLLRDAMRRAPNVWVVNASPEALARLGLASGQAEIAPTGSNLPLARVRGATLAERFVASPYDGAVWGEGWLPNPYMVADEPVRWTGSGGTLALPLWTPAHRQFSLRFWVPAATAGRTLTLLAEGTEIGRVTLQEGWQTTAATVPEALAQGRTSLQVALQVADAPTPPLAIGQTGVVAPLPLAAQAGCVEGHAFARLWVGETLLDWDAAGKGFGRAYNMVAVEPQGGAVLDWQAFDTNADGRGDPTESNRMLAWVSGLPAGTIVVGAVKDDASLSLAPSGVEALRALGSAVDLRGQFRGCHALIGVKGAAPGTAQEAGPSPTAIVAVGTSSQTTLAVASVVLEAVAPEE